MADLSGIAVGNVLGRSPFSHRSHQRLWITRHQLRWHELQSLMCQLVSTFCR
ncbi:hypothetical protein NG791_09200 [Laspinema sp. D1]|uniref:hypothetical protein n=1 Tax=Laspinema palackyanum TaxID=3231601 RepID=UPI00347116E5|nr:hypothetical protein [Laspinema sp. D2b]